MASRREVTAAVAMRYQGSTRSEKESILNEFTQVTSFHRKRAIRVLNQEASKLGTGAGGLRRTRIYDQAVQEALIVVWEAADRICTKRLKQILPVLVGSMERHRHLQLDPDVRQRLLKMSAATMDRLLKAIREVSDTGRHIGKRTLSQASGSGLGTISGRSLTNLAAWGEGMAQRDGSSPGLRSWQRRSDTNQQYNDGFMTSTMGPGAEGWLWKRRSVEKSSRLSHLAWKSRNSGGIPTFRTATAATN